ncbi:hypothetical protein QTP88_011707 [Uroleucon formosanum]
MILLAGDFRQTLPVIPRSTPADELNACLKSSNLWKHVKVLHLSKNMCVELQNDQSGNIFSKQLIDIEQSTGESRIYKSVDSVTNQDDVVNYPPEFINSLDLPGLPPYNLQVKVGSFPVRLAFAMTINKSQEQSLSVCGINLENPCFSHGQLYVACSCVGKPSDLFVYAPVYILMVDRSKDAYIEVLKALKSVVSNLMPQRIMVDFKMAFISAYKDEFPTTEIKCCFFHFQQCSWRKIQSCGLQQMYGDDVEFSMQIRLLSALAFIPTINVIRTFEELIDSTYFLENEELLSPIIDYFEDTWIGRRNRNNRRRSPQFDFCMWNCYDSVLKHQPRTNNAVRCWHHAFNSALADIMLRFENL